MFSFTCWYTNRNNQRYNSVGIDINEIKSCSQLLIEKFITEEVTLIFVFRLFAIFFFMGSNLNVNLFTFYTQILYIRVHTECNNNIYNIIRWYLLIKYFNMIYYDAVMQAAFNLH